MKILFTLIVLLADIPSSLYDSYCTKETIDSVYSASRVEAEADYAGDADAATCYLIADWAYNVSLIDLSEYFIESALDHEVEDRILRADCLSMASAVARLRGDLYRAIEYAESCLMIDEESGNKENISSSLNNIAGLYLTYGDAQTARKYIDEAILLEEALGRRPYLAIRYGVASEIYMKLGELDQALVYADKALELDELDGRIQKAAVRRSQKGAVLMELGNYPEAKKNLELALPVFKKQNNLNSLAITYAQLGDIAFHNGDIEGAAAAFNESVRISAGIGHLYLESRARYGLYRIYKDVSLGKALSALERYVEIEKELHGEKTTQMMQSFNVRYETLKKEHTIVLQEQAIRTRTILVLFLFVLFVLAGVLAFMRNKAVKAMEERNAILVRANLDKDRLLSLSNHNMPDEVNEEMTSILSDVESMPKIKLTKREIQIAELCSQGKLNKEIAVELGISQRTVETHKNNLFRKLGINNTVELMRYMQWYTNKNVFSGEIEK